MMNEVVDNEIVNKSLEIPKKSMFKVDELCSLLGIKPYVLRFWESEFDVLNPVISSTGQKLYDHRDIEIIAQIKKFLFEDKLVIEKAKFEIKKMFDPPLVSVQVEESKSEEIPEITRRYLGISDIEKLGKAKELLLSITAQIKLRNPLIDQVIH